MFHFLTVWRLLRSSHCSGETVRERRNMLLSCVADCECIGRFRLSQEPRLHRTLPLYLNRRSRFQEELILQPLICRLGYLNFTGLPGCLHPRRHIHSIAPHIIEELASPNHASYDRTAGDADTDRDVASKWIAQVRGRVTHFERKLCQRPRMVQPRRRYATHDHIRIPCGLDLFNLVALDEFVEISEYAIEESPQRIRGGVAASRCEARHVGKQDRRFVVFVGNQGFWLALEPLSDRDRKNVNK